MIYTYESLQDKINWVSYAQASQDKELWEVVEDNVVDEELLDDEVPAVKNNIFLFFSKFKKKRI